MNQESPEYVVRNYDAVDRQVSEISRREAIISRKLEIANQKNLAKNFILFAAAAFILLLGIGIAIWLAKDDPLPPKIIEVTNEKIIERVVSAPTEKNSPATAEMQQAAQRIQATATENDGDAEKVTVNFTVFYTHNLSDKESINTGYDYQPNNIKDPEKQFCYHDINTGGFKRNTTDLASKKGDGEVIWFPLANDRLKSLAKTHCKFI